MGKSVSAVDSLQGLNCARRWSIWGDRRPEGACAHLSRVHRLPPNPTVAQILVDLELDANRVEVVAEAARPSCCGCCGAEGTLRRHGSYRRYAGNTLVYILRWLCRVCRRTTSTLPISLCSWVSHRFETVQRAVAAVGSGESYRRVARQLGQSVSWQQVRRWARRFTVVKGYLASLLGIGSGAVGDWLPLRRRLFAERLEVWHPFGFHRVAATGY